MQAHPLQWPTGWPRTAPNHTARARFKTSLASARDSIVSEVRRLGGKDLVISTNIPVRNDGLPYASARPPTDAGVAVYFTYKGRQKCFPCDRWDKVESNMQAIALTIQAMRGIERWGSGQMLDAMFTGFTALPPPQSQSQQAQTLNWRDVLGLEQHSALYIDDIERAFREKAKHAHPDYGGSAEAFAELVEAKRLAISHIQREV